MAFLRSKLLILILLLTFYPELHAQRINSTPPEVFALGETIELTSAILNEKRTINIYLPDGYDRSAKDKYDIIYLLDGSANEDFIHIVGLVQFFNLNMNKPGTIVVGIGNVDRKRDFTFPTENPELKKDYPTTGHSEKFISFLEKELKPFIHDKYKVGANETLLGQSLGGLLATEILLKKPGLFNNYIIVSPSLWWDDESLLRAAPVLLTSHQDVDRKVTILVGKEGKVMEDDAQSLAVLLQNSKLKNLKVDFIPMPKEDHATILHNAVYEVFLKMIPKTK